MNTWTAIKKLESENGERNVEICVNPDGKLFRFYENAWIEVGEEELLSPRRRLLDMSENVRLLRQYQRVRRRGS